VNHIHFLGEFQTTFPLEFKSVVFHRKNDDSAMKVFVKFYAHLRDLVEKQERLEIELDSPATVTQLLDELIQDKKIQKHIFDDEMQVKSDITLLINGREIKFLDGINTILKQGDEVSIFPMVAGG